LRITSFKAEVIVTAKGVGPGRRLVGGGIAQRARPAAFQVFCLDQAIRLEGADPSLPVNGSDHRSFFEIAVTATAGRAQFVGGRTAPRAWPAQRFVLSPSNAPACPIRKENEGKENTKPSAQRSDFLFRHFPFREQN
jgi:hypothetical protein